MTEKEREQMRARLRMRYKRRARAMIKDMHVRHWTAPDMLRFLDRLELIAGDAVVERDLRVLVRMYNRELIGRWKLQREKLKEINREK